MGLFRHSDRVKQETFDSTVASFRSNRDLRASGLPTTADYFWESVTEAVKDGRLTEADLKEAERRSWLP